MLKIQILVYVANIIGAIIAFFGMSRFTKLSKAEAKKVSLSYIIFFTILFLVGQITIFGGEQFDTLVDKIFSLIIFLVCLSVFVFPVLQNPVAHFFYILFLKAWGFENFYSSIKFRIIFLILSVLIFTAYLY